MLRMDRFKKFILYFAAINVISLLCLIIFSGSKGILGKYIRSSYFYSEDRFADFYNPALYASDRQLVDNKITNSPPFLHFCGYLTSLVTEKLVPGGLEQGLSFWTSFIGYFLWISVVTVVSIIICIRLSKFFHSKKWFLISFFSIILSYPYIFTIDRGNYVLITLLLVILFITSYENNSKWSFLWLGLAASFKLYPALLGVIYIRDKKWKDAVMSASIFFLLLLVSFAFFSMKSYSFSETFADWILKVKLYSTHGNGAFTLLASSSIRPFLMVITSICCNISFLKLYSNSLFSIPNYMVLLTIVISCLFLKKNHDVYLLLVLGMILFPIESGIYNLILVIFPILYYLYKEKSLMVFSLSMILFLVKPMFLVSLLNPLCSIIIVIYVLYSRKNEFRLKKEVSAHD